MTKPTLMRALRMEQMVAGFVPAIELGGEGAVRSGGQSPPIRYAHSSGRSKRRMALPSFADQAQPLRNSRLGLGEIGIDDPHTRK